MDFNRRDFLRLSGMGGIVFASGLGFNAFGSDAGKRANSDFYFVQLSDTHWGFAGPNVNPDAQGTLKKAIATVNSLDEQPDFVVFTGDLTHTTDDVKIRNDRMSEFKDIIGGLKAKTVYLMAGEHDASLDRGDAYQQHFGELHYTFDHKGIHFIVLDNVSDPNAVIGDTQLQWLQSDLKKQKIDTPIVVFTHRPLFDLYPQWDWATKDAAPVIDELMPYKNVTVFYGHIHQENHHMTGHIAHHAAKSLIFPLPAPGSQPKRAPVPWDAAAPYRGLGFRDVEANTKRATFFNYRATSSERLAAMNKKRVSISLCAICAIAVVGSLGFRFRYPAILQERTIKITAKKFEFSPGEVTVKKGETVILELSSADRVHGFSLPDFKIRTEIKPDEVARVRFTPDKTGQFTFTCDVFCGSGHEDMGGTFTVTE